MGALGAQRLIAGFAAALLSWSALPVTARAQEPKLQSGQAPPEAMARFEKGRGHFRAGRYREAIVELKAALELDPGSPVLRYNVAYTSELLGDLPEAIKYYRQYLAVLPRSAREERQRTRTTLRRLEGRREVAEDEADDPGGGRADALFWVTLAGGAALLGGAAVTGVMALDREDEVTVFVVGRDGSVGDRQSLMDEADNLALASDVSIAGGAALVATSALLYFLRGDDEPVEPTKPARGRKRGKKRAPRAALTSDGRGAYLVVRATF